ncbi:MAG: universal stress protein [Pseudonocardiaceae bacterium]
MIQVLAATDRTETAPAVDGVAAAVAQVLHSDIRRVRSEPGQSAKTVQLLQRVLNEPETLLGVLAVNEPSPAACWRIIQESTKPLIIVPAALRSVRPISRVLVPLDGTAESAGAVAETVDLFARAGVDLVILHVFDETTVPRFWDQVAHARRAWEAEFLARYCRLPGIRLELRQGVAGEHVVDVAATEQVDLITLGWSQRLGPGRACIVRKTVRDAVVPVMLVPVVAS